MTSVLVDTSVLIKWFHSEGESELSEARLLRDAHVAGNVDAYILDLGMYELGNVFLRALHWNASAAADQLDDVVAICGPPLVSSPAWLRAAASVAEAHKLSFYDAAWAAAAQALSVPLVSADRQLLSAGLAHSVSALTVDLGLRSHPG